VSASVSILNRLLFLILWVFSLNDGKPTCPSKWAEEKSYNPFLRFNESSVKKFTGATDPIEVLVSDLQ
jgi:hypothetical protein